MCFGKRLEQVRKDKRINQCDLAKKLNLTQQTISSYEKGINKPSIDILLGLSIELGVSCDYLLTGRIASDINSEDQVEVLSLYKRIPRTKHKQVIEILSTFINEKN